MQINDRYVLAAGHKIAVQATNENLEGIPIILIHGVLASYKFWNEIFPTEIKDNNPWYSVSLPGHHPSKVDNDAEGRQINEEWFIDYLNDVTRQLVGEREYILVGHSTGGFAALNYATTKPKNLRGVISIAGFYQGNWGGIEGAIVKLASWGSWAKPLFITNLALGRLSFSVQRWLSAQLAYDKEAYLKSPMTNKMLKCIQPLMKKQKLINLFPLFNRIKHLNILSKIKNISVPCFIFAGNKDPVISASQSLILAAHIPKATTIAYDQVGHMPFMEREADFANDLIEAIKELSQITTSKI